MCPTHAMDLLDGIIQKGEIQNMISADCVEEDPQDEKQTSADFAVAIAFMIFGMIAFISGMVSIVRSI
jgi:hypothetical protein